MEKAKPSLYGFVIASFRILLSKERLNFGFLPGLRWRHFSSCNRAFGSEGKMEKAGVR